MSAGVLVLAGRRGGAVDPLAAAAGVADKCLVPVAGEAMLGRVLRTAAAALPAARLFVSVANAAAIAQEPTVARLRREGRLTVVAAKANIVDSICAGGEAGGYPLVVTTADNVLMTQEALRRLVARGSVGDADALVVLARREDVLAAHADGQRRFYALKDGAYSNCNLFWLGSPAALRAAESFRGGGQFAKFPVRIVRAFGIANLIRFRFGLASLPAMFGHISRRFGIRVSPMLVDDGRLAIDVDNERTLRVAEEIIAGQTPAAAVGCPLRAPPRKATGPTAKGGLDQCDDRNEDSRTGSQDSGYGGRRQKAG